MVFFSHRVNRDEIKAGDHIYAWRTLFIYSHHGIYVGENKVIHFNSDQAKATSASGSNLTPHRSNSPDCEFSQPISGHSCGSGSCLCTYYCGFHQPESGVTLSCLNCFLKKDSLYLYEYGVSRWILLSKLRGGTCTTAQSDPPQDVINRAIYLLRQQKGFRNYNLVTNNCEDFALYCKTGLLIPSSQVLQIFGVSKFVAFLPSSFMNPLGRYNSDIGVRNDAVRVPMEDAESFKLINDATVPSNQTGEEENVWENNQNIIEFDVSKYVSK
ncbi:putative LRAT domain-containing protein [Helianthus anomalus]